MSLRDQLQGIYDSHGELTPRLVLDEARDPAHPLHDRFEWDDSVAAERYRLDQAHRLIITAKIVYRKAKGKTPARDVRAFHAVRTPKGHVYEPAEKVASDELLTAMVMRDMERDWKALKARYGHFAEFVRMVRADVEAGAA